MRLTGSDLGVERNSVSPGQGQCRNWPNDSIRLAILRGEPLEDFLTPLCPIEKVTLWVDLAIRNQRSVELYGSNTMVT